MGLAGAVAADQGSVESAFWNPAGLASLKDWQATMMTGPEGQQGPWHSALALAGPDGDLGFFGFSATDSRYFQGAAFRVNQAALSMAVPVGPFFSLGTSQKFLSADPGGLSGWAMDLGAQCVLPLPESLGDRLVAGVDAIDLASALSWSTGLSELQPALLQAGLAWKSRSASSLAVQMDQSDGPDTGPVPQWRAGASQGIFGGHLALRAGATQAQGSALYLCGGLGLKARLFGTGYRLDYAILAPQQARAGVDFTRQILALSLDFGGGEEPAAGQGGEGGQARVTHLLTDPRTRRIRHARFSLRGIQGAPARQWELTITDSKGEALRTFKGTGPLPQGITWNGLDQKGRPVADQALGYTLRTVTADGQSFTRKAILKPPSQAAFGSGEDLEGLGLGGDMALRSSPERSGPGPVVRPSLKGMDGSQLAGADFDLSDVSSRPVKQWELKVVDASGKVVKVYSGKGAVPDNIHWQATDSEGRPLADGLDAGYVLRTVDPQGRSRVVRGSVVTNQAFAAALAPAAPTAPASSVSFPESMDAQVWTCVVYFPPDGAALTTGQLKALRRLAGIIQAGGPEEVQINGYTDGVEQGSPDRTKLSQERANAVLGALLDGLSADPRALVARAFGAANPAASNRTERGRRLNRRVEVVVHRSGERVRAPRPAGAGRLSRPVTRPAQALDRPTVAAPGPARPAGEARFKPLPYEME